MRAATKTRLPHIKSRLAILRLERKTKRSIAARQGWITRNRRVARDRANAEANLQAIRVKLRSIYIQAQFRQRNRIWLVNHRDEFAKQPGDFQCWARTVGLTTYAAIN